MPAAHVPRHCRGNTDSPSIPGNPRLAQWLTPANHFSNTLPRDGFEFAIVIDITIDKLHQCW